MRVLVVGLGSIGRRHLANLRTLLPPSEIVVWHQHSKPADHAAPPPEANRVVYALEDALAFKPEIAIVASPAALHVQTALSLAQAGVHLLIEKPLSDSLDGVDALLELCRSKKLALLVAYNLRFSESLRAVKQALLDGRIGRIMSLRAEVGQYLPDWRPNVDYRKGVSAQKKLGGGVLLELSHELDYVHWLAGEVESVAAQAGKLSDLELDVEDTAEIILRFKNGAFGSVHLDMTQRSMTRTCRIVGTAGTLTWDALAHEARCYSADSRDWSELHPARVLDRNELYVAELKHFLNCVNGVETPLVDGAQGRRILQLVLAARESSATQTFVNV